MSSSSDRPPPPRVEPGRAVAVPARGAINVRDELIDQAQICESGHVITDQLHHTPNRAQKACDQCGRPTLATCPHCGHPIRGHNHAGYAPAWRKPLYCEECGRPFPWMEAHLAAAEEILVMGDVPEAERRSAAKDLVDVATDTPRTPAAAMRLVDLAKKLGPHVGEGLKRVVIEVSTEAAKKSMGL